MKLGDVSRLPAPTRPHFCPSPWARPGITSHPGPAGGCFTVYLWNGGGALGQQALAALAPVAVAGFDRPRLATPSRPHFLGVSGSSLKLPLQGVPSASPLMVL